MLSTESDTGIAEECITQNTGEGESAPADSPPQRHSSLAPAKAIHQPRILSCIAQAARRWSFRTEQALSLGETFWSTKSNR